MKGLTMSHYNKNSLGEETGLLGTTQTKSHLGLQFAVSVILGLRSPDAYESTDRLACH